MVSPNSDDRACTMYQDPPLSSIMAMWGMLLDEMSCVGRWRGSREEDFVGASQPLSTSLSAKQRLVIKDRASCADNPEVVCVSSANGS